MCRVIPLKRAKSGKIVLKMRFIVLRDFEEKRESQAEVLITN